MYFRNLRIVFLWPMNAFVRFTLTGAISPYGFCICCGQCLTLVLIVIMLFIYCCQSSRHVNNPPFMKNKIHFTCNILVTSPLHQLCFTTILHRSITWEIIWNCMRDLNINVLIMQYTFHSECSRHSMMLLLLHTPYY